MSKITFEKPGNFIYPVPAVLVSLQDKSGKKNIVTIAWTETVCSDPPMAYISVRHERASYPMLKETGEFVINLPDESMVKALDYCGVKSGAKVDKWKDCSLTPGKASVISAPTCLHRVCGKGHYSARLARHVFKRSRRCRCR